MHGNKLVIKTSCVDTLLVVSLKSTGMQKVSTAMTSATLSGNTLIQGGGGGGREGALMWYQTCV